jgi:hypothetical protein
MAPKWLSAFLLAISACTQEPTGVQPGTLTVEVTEVGRTDPEVELSLRVKNTGQAPVHFEGCPNVPSVVVEGLAGIGWQEVGSVNLYCIAILSHRREVLKPGGSFQTRLAVVNRGLLRLRVLYGFNPADPYAEAQVSHAIQVD